MKNLQKIFFVLATSMAAFSCGYKPSIKKSKWHYIELTTACVIDIFSAIQSVLNNSFVAFLSVVYFRAGADLG